MRARTRVILIPKKGGIGMADHTRRLLSEVEKTAAFGRDSVKAVLRHVDNDHLRQELSRSRNRYRTVVDEAHNTLASLGCHSGRNPQSVKMMMRTAINAQLNRKRDVSRAAEMMIQGCTMGNIELLKAIHDNPAASTRAVDIAEHAITEQERTIESMKRFL